MGIVKGVTQLLYRFWPEGVVYLGAIDSDSGYPIHVVIEDVLKVKAIDSLPLHGMHFPVLIDWLKSTVNSEERQLYSAATAFQ
jgi:hypothetical protein